MLNRIRALREEKKMTQVRLGIELDVTQETISAYEVGKHYPSVASLIKMSTLFDASTDYILGLSDLRVPLRKSDLSADEVAFLSLYRRLGPNKKEKAEAFIKGMLE